MFFNVWNKKHPDYQWDDDAMVMVKDPNDPTKQVRVRKFGLLIKNGSGFENMVKTHKTVEWTGKMFTMKDDPYTIVQKGDMIRLLNKDPHGSPKEFEFKVNAKAKNTGASTINISNPPKNPAEKSEFELLVNQVGKSAKVKITEREIIRMNICDIINLNLCRFKTQVVTR